MDNVFIRCTISIVANLAGDGAKNCMKQYFLSLPLGQPFRNVQMIAFSFQCEKYKVI